MQSLQSQWSSDTNCAELLIYVLNFAIECSVTSLLVSTGNIILLSSISLMQPLKENASKSCINVHEVCIELQVICVAFLVVKATAVRRSV